MTGVQFGDQVSRRNFGMGAGALTAGAIAGAVSQDAKADAGSRSTSSMSKVESFQKLAETTVRIILPNGTGLGSGYHFLQPNIIVSNAHVVLDQRAVGQAIFADSEQGRLNLKVLASSPPEQFDFAIMQASGPGVEGRSYLVSDGTFYCERGEGVIYAGFPHGIAQLIVASSEISSPIAENKFSINAMIHGGNSGGPIVDAGSLRVKGTVTARRFFVNPELVAAEKEMADLQKYLQAIQGQGSVQIMGVDFTKFAYVMSRIASLTNELLMINSTTGIGIGNSIEPVIRQCKSLGLG